MKNEYFGLRIHFIISACKQFIIQCIEELKNLCPDFVSQNEKEHVEMKTEMKWCLASMLIIGNENKNYNTNKAAASETRKHMSQLVHRFCARSHQVKKGRR